MKYVVALAACALVILFWSIIGATVFNWQHGGGILWQLVIWGTVVAVWIAITARWPEEKISTKGGNKPKQRSGLVSALDLFNVSSKYDTPAQSKDITGSPQNSPANKANYAKALEELERGSLDQGTWAMALSESMGKEQEARALYIRFRVDELNQLVERQLEHDALAKAKIQQDAERLELERKHQNIFDCPCGFSGKAKIKARGSVIICLFLFCLLYIPGIIYALLYRGYKAVCPNCGRILADRVKP